MKLLYSDEPIIACSTGTQSHVAMAVLRISGFDEFSQFSQFFSISGPIEPRKVYYTRLLDGDNVVDDICLTYFQGPKSYNGENILELSVHGNTLNVERILNLFINKGNCRHAGPGEFTYRALKNKKLTLSQVEGLDLFLNANTGYALEQGLSLLSGGLQKIYTDVLDLFLKHKAAVELSIDFLEDIGEAGAKVQFDDTLNAFSEKFSQLVSRVLPMDQNLIQPEITLAGLPNSGKSSLFNILLKDDRAIVSNIPGTTRDYLSESIVIEGVKYKLVDTAGVRVAVDQIEAEGIRRTKKKMSDSFFSILLINPLQVGPELDELLKHPFDMILYTHADQAGFKITGPIGPAINLLSQDRSWEKEIYAKINKKYLSLTSGQPLLLERHKSLILQANNSLKEYRNLAMVESDIAILSSELNSLGHLLSELIGIISPDQILNSIFSNFCIGK